MQTHDKPINIIVTAGGTKEPIDEVRNITNSSSGKLGIKIVEQMTHKYPNANIYLVESLDSNHNNVLQKADTYTGNIYRLPIKTTKDLEDQLRHLLKKYIIDICIHAMAVSDYTVDRVVDLSNINDIESIYDAPTLNTSSKISSDIEQPAVLLKKNPKIIKLIKKLSPHTFLVGFKLLDHTNTIDLFDAGFNLLRNDRCNLVVANDIADIRAENHKAMLIFPEKSYEIISGESIYSKDILATRLCDVIAQRAFVKHPKSIIESKTIAIPTDIVKNFHFIGHALFKNGYLPEVIQHDGSAIGTYGNMSIRNENSNLNGFYITGRNVHKGHLSSNDLCNIEFVHFMNDDTNVYSYVHYHGIKKPSIDTSIHAALYETYENVYAILHVHTDDIFLGIPYIDDMYPCGSMEEKDAILKAFKDNDIIQMKKHGLIICGLSLDLCYSKLQALYSCVPYIHKEPLIYPTSKENIDAECMQHINDVHADFIFDTPDSDLYNIHMRQDIIGIVWENYSDINESVDFGIYTKPIVHNIHLGIVQKYLNLYNKQYYLHTTPDCNIEDFYKTKYGFIPCAKSENHISLCRPRYKN